MFDDLHRFGGACDFHDPAQRRHAGARRIDDVERRFGGRAQSSPIARRGQFARFVQKRRDDHVAVVRGERSVRQGQRMTRDRIKRDLFAHIAEMLLQLFDGGAAQRVDDEIRTIDIDLVRRRPGLRRRQGESEQAGRRPQQLQRVFPCEETLRFGPIAYRDRGSFRREPFEGLDPFGVGDGAEPKPIDRRVEPHDRLLQSIVVVVPCGRFSRNSPAIRRRRRRRTRGWRRCARLRRAADRRNPSSPEARRSIRNRRRARRRERCRADPRRHVERWSNRACRTGRNCP